MEIRALALSDKPASLRKAIANDLGRGKHRVLWIESAKVRGRSGGWSKIKAIGIAGVINIDWDGVGKTLTIRAIAEKGKRPDEIMGEFVGYLFKKFGSRITTVVNAGRAGK